MALASNTCDVLMSNTIVVVVFVDVTRGATRHHYTACAIVCDVDNNIASRHCLRHVEMRNIVSSRDDHDGRHVTLEINIMRNFVPHVAVSRVLCLSLVEAATGSFRV